MAVAIVTSANLGKKCNLKTTDIEPVIRAFAQNGELSQVLCQLTQGFFFSRAKPAIPAVIRYPWHAFDRFGFLSRRTFEAVFDWFAARRLARTEIVILHGAHFLPRTLAQARRNGSTVIDIAVIANLAMNTSLEKEEGERLGVGAYESTYAQMQRVGAKMLPDYVIALSEFTKESYRRAGMSNNHMYVASPDIDLQRFAPASASLISFRVVYMAHTTLLKGLHYLLQAWKQLALPDAELIIAGGWDVSPQLKAQYDELIETDATISVKGNTQTPETLYREASVLVFPSLTEGFGRVTLEAMACGIPAITTENARGIVEDGKTGFVVPIRDVDVLAEKIKYLYEHQDIAKKMGQEARRAVEAKKPFGEAVYEIYQDIMKREGKL